MQNTTLVIMAAGMGSRFGKGTKQLSPVGPKGQLLIDYSISDALAAGFHDVVFIIRKDLEAEFREMVGDRTAEKCPVTYVFQSIDQLPAGFAVPAERKKPWGTGQALLCCKEVVKNPFVVINADDYYGKEGFRKVHQFLVTPHGENAYCMAGFLLKNTVSRNGTVSRGICTTDAEGQLLSVVETGEIVALEQNGTLLAAREKDGVMTAFPEETLCSMNFWGLNPSVFAALETGFSDFLQHMKNPEKDEFYLPFLISDQLEAGRCSVSVLKTEDHWLGMTYAADREAVLAAFRAMEQQ